MKYRKMMRVLTREVINDPEGIGYGPDDTDAQLAAKLNEKNRTFLRRLTHGESVLFVTEAGRLRKLERAAQDPALQTTDNDALLSIVKGLLAMLPSEDFRLDPSNKKIGAMLDGLIAGGVWSAQDKADFLAEATTTDSRARELGLLDEDDAEDVLEEELVRQCRSK